MLFFDRHWWLRTAGALGCGLYAAALPVWYVLFLVPLDVRHGVPVWADSLAALAAVAGLLVLAVLLWRSAGHARQREHLRRAALPDDHDTIPRFTPPRPSGTPARGRIALPLTVRLPDALLPGPFLGLPVAFIGAIALCADALLLVRWPIVCVQARLASGGPPDSLTAAPFAGGTGAIAGVLVAALYFCLAAREYLAQPVSIVSSGDEICARTWWGRRRCIPWRELRLLEISAYTDPGGVGTGWRPIRVYTLHGQGTRIRWHEAVPASGKVSEKTAQLLDVVRECTGLEPRTFDRKLQGGVGS